MQRDGFQCPKCLQQVPVSAELAGTRIDCPHCQASLAVPNSIGTNHLFDDLFDEPTQRTKSGVAKPIGTPQIPADTAADKPKKSAADANRMPTHQSKPADETPPAESRDRETGADPFGYDESRPLRIDGVSANIVEADAFYFSCPTCDSKIQVRGAQLGERIRCSDCHSTITVAKPVRTEKQLDVWRMPATLKVSEDEDFRLEPPIERPDIATHVNAQFGLGDVQDDLLTPRLDPEIPKSKRLQTPVNATGPKKTGSANKVRSQTGTGRTGPLKTGASPSTVRPDSSHRLPIDKTIPSPKPANSKVVDQKRLDSLATATGSPLQQMFNLEFSKDLDLLIRTVVTVVFLAVGYTLMESISTTWAREDMNAGEKFGKLFPVMLAAPVCIGVAAWFLTITYSVLMRAVANGQTRIEAWVGFAPAEWFGLFAITAFGIWAAMLPGVLLGYFAWSITGWFIFLPISAAISVFVLSPLFLICSFFNESVFSIFSPEIAQTFSDKNADWPGAYRNFAIILGVFVIGIAIAYLPSLLFSLIAAAVQVVAVMALAVLTGFHTRKVIQCVRAH